MKYLIFTLLLSSSVVFCYSQGHGAKTDAKAKKNWIKNSSREMKNFSPVAGIDTLNPRLLDFGDYKMISYRVKGESLIIARDGSWIYIKPHSSHDDTLVGDISLAMSSEGIFYVNTGHICGGIVNYRCKTDQIPAKAENFFGCYLTDTDDQPWILLKKYK